MTNKSGENMGKSQIRLGNQPTAMGMLSVHAENFGCLVYRILQPGAKT